MQIFSLPPSHSSKSKSLRTNCCRRQEQASQFGTKKTVLQKCNRRTCSLELMPIFKIATTFKIKSVHHHLIVIKPPPSTSTNLSYFERRRSAIRKSNTDYRGLPSRPQAIFTTIFKFDQPLDQQRHHRRRHWVSEEEERRWERKLQSKRQSIVFNLNITTITRQQTTSKNCRQFQFSHKEISLPLLPTELSYSSYT